MGPPAAARGTPSQGAAFGAKAGKGNGMRAWRKIFCPVDFSERSRAAMDIAVELSKRFGAELTLMHVCVEPEYSRSDAMTLEGPVERETVTENFERALADLKAQAETMGAQNVSTAVVRGTPFAEIVRFARQGDFDLIVMGTHGRTGLVHALLGSVAEKVVRKAPCAVLTVRLPGHEFRMP